MSSRMITRKTGAVLLICSMFLSLCGCNALSKKDVVAAAKEVAENIEDFDADKLLDLSTLSKKSDKAEDLRKGLNGEYLDENTKKFCTAVRKTFTFEIREDSFSISGNEASIDIDFTMADYESILKKDYKDIDELVSAVKNTDDFTTVTYTARFVKEDKEWRLDNLMSSNFLKLFAFMDADIGVLAVDFSKLVNTKRSTWQGADNDTYKNTKKLSLLVSFNEEISKLKGKGVKVTYDVAKDGFDVWKSDPIEIGDKNTLLLEYSKDIDPNAELRSNYLSAGMYGFTLKADNGTFLYAATVNVVVAVTETRSGTGNTNSNGYKFYDSEFASRVMSAAWVNVDNKRVNAVSYGSDATRISFQMQMDPSTTEPIYFAFYYAVNTAGALKINVRTDTPAISGEGTPIVNSNGTFFALGLKSKTGQSMKSGIYILAMFSRDKQTLLGIAECQILPNPTSAYQ